MADLNTALIMYKAYHNQLPHCMQELFKERDTEYELRGTGVLKRSNARINIKARCLSVRGVCLWNSLESKLKMCPTVKIFKKMFKDKVMDKYKAIEQVK